MAEPTLGEVVKELHKDLGRKYALHATAIEKAWRSFDKATRVRCLKVGMADGVVLAHPMGRSMGVVYKLAPEINLGDVTEPNSDFLLDHLRHRATTSLLDQYSEGAYGGLGDPDFIDMMMHTRNLQLTEPFHDCYSFFIDEESYGQAFKIVRDKEQFLADIALALRVRMAIPQSTGELVLLRQECLMQSLNILVEDILDMGAQNRDKKQRAKKPARAAGQALSKLTFHEAPVKATFSDMLANVQEQKPTLRTTSACSLRSPSS